MRRFNCGQLLLATITLSLLQGCASLPPGQKYGSTQVASLKSAYVVAAEESDQDEAMRIQGELAKRGLRVTSGLLNAKPSDVDFYVTFSAHWTWDMTMYLSALDIQFLDNRSGQLIASGGYGQSLIHGYPDVKEITRQVIDSIYAAK